MNYLFTGTVMENIRYAKPDATEADVIRAAKAIGSYDAIMSLKDGFKTEVGERGANMTLGQRQLICFTRAFLADPRIFMLDEATSAVDTATELLVQESLEKTARGPNDLHRRASAQHDHEGRQHPGDRPRPDHRARHASRAVRRERQVRPSLSPVRPSWHVNACRILPSIGKTG